jgi:hypothetical protein
MLFESSREHSSFVGEGRKDRGKEEEHREGVRARECWQRVVRWSLADSSDGIITTDHPCQGGSTENAFSRWLDLLIILTFFRGILHG